MKSSAARVIRHAPLGAPGYFKRPKSTGPSKGESMDTNQGPAAIFKHTAFGQILKAVLVSTVFFSALVHAAPIAVEKIFVSQFEAQPVGIYPRIEFVGDRTQIFSGPDETRTATVRIFDASGTLIADPSIDWVSGDGALLSVSPTVPGEAQLQSEGAWDGSLTYQAAYAPLGLTISGQALRAVFPNISSSAFWSPSPDAGVQTSRRKWASMTAATTGAPRPARTEIGWCAADSDFVFS